MDANSFDFFNTGLNSQNRASSNPSTPDRSGVLIQAALTAYDMKDYKGALRLCDEILDVLLLQRDGEDLPVIWKFRGQCLYYLKQYEEAISSFDKGLKLGIRTPSQNAMMEELFFWKILTLYHNTQYITARAIIKEYLSSPEYLRSKRTTQQANEMKKKVNFELRGLRGFFYKFRKLK